MDDALRVVIWTTFAAVALADIDYWVTQDGYFLSNQP
jgi:hypothetical protein